MTQKTYIVEGRQFRTESDYRKAMRDKQTMETLRGRTDFGSVRQLQRLLADLREGKYRFYTILGQDFREEVEEALANHDQTRAAAPAPAEKRRGGKAENKKRTADKGRSVKQNAARQRGVTGKAEKSAHGEASQTQEELDAIIKEELLRQEKRRRRIVVLCSMIAAVCLGYFALYTYQSYRTSRNNELLSALRERSAGGILQEQGLEIHYTDKNREAPEVLEEYKTLVNKNKKLIGWVRIADINTNKPMIDYPVMQTNNNEYYLDHNLNQEKDKNGSIFLDKDCDVLKPSTNFILYGHNMKSGQMFGDLDKYSSEDFYESHKYIQFDTIYEKGTYEVMYVFRSRIYKEEEIVFKYYQFIDALSEQEFDSYMQEMAAISLYETGVTAQFGDQLLTLSTCDYSVNDGRFVVVAKKIA